MYLIALILATHLAAETLPASVDQTASVVRFEPEADRPDREALAEQRLGAQTVDHPPAGTVQRLLENRGDFNDAVVPFTVTLPSLLKARKYYLLATRGIIPLTPGSFEGQVHYVFDEAATSPTISRIEYGGEIVAKLSDQADQTVGGFVFVSDEVPRFAIKPVELSSLSARRDSLTYIDQGVHRQARVEADGHPDQIHFASRIAVEPGGEEYLFVQWRPDDSFCEFAFSLLKMTGQGMREVKWSAYNCDI